MEKRKERKNGLPDLVNCEYEDSLNRLANRIVESYERKVYPTLILFRLFDDEHIQKYLGCSTAEDIYLDALQKDSERMRILERDAFFNDTDIWASIRDISSPVESPNEEGFVFSKLPCSDEHRKSEVLKALSVKDCKIHVNREMFLEMSIIKPTERQIELYEFLADFCENLEKKNYRKKHLYTLLEVKNGKMVPNIRSIIECNWVKRK